MSRRARLARLEELLALRRGHVRIRFADFTLDAPAPASAANDAAAEPQHAVADDRGARRSVDVQAPVQAPGYCGECGTTSNLDDRPGAQRCFGCGEVLPATRYQVQPEPARRPGMAPITGESGQVESNALEVTTAHEGRA